MESSCDVDLKYLITKLKIGEYDGVDIMHARIAINELITIRAENEELIKFRDAAFKAHPNIDMDIEMING